MVLLLGQIFTATESIDSNGAGKSVIVDAITIAITGTISRGLNKESVIRYGESTAVVAFILQHSVTQEVLMIYREVNANKSNELLLHINEKVVTGFDKMKRTAQEWLYEKLGITEEDFLSYFVINQGQQSTFITSTDTKQKEVISRFSNYSKLEPVIERIASEIKENEKQQFLIQGIIQTKSSNLETVQNYIEELQNSDDYAENKKELETKIAGKQQSVSQIEKEVARASNEVGLLQLELEGLKKQNKQKLTIAQLQTKLGEIRKLKDQQLEDLNDLREVQSQLAVKSGKLIKCPNCKWEFLANDGMTKAELQASKEHVEGEIAILANVLPQSQNNIEKLKIRIEACEQLNELEAKVARKQNRIKEFETQVSDYNKNIKQLTLDLKNLKQGSNKALIKTQQTKVSALAQEVFIAKFQLEEAIQQNEELKFHLFSFDKQFRTYIANKTIRTIQDVINYYLQSLKIDLRILINGFKILKNQEIREKIQIYVLKDNQQVPIKATSGGERGRSALASVLALHYLSNQTNPTGGLNLLCFDEFLEALDASGQNEMIKLMEAANVTCVLVAHHVSDSQAKNKVYVQKKGTESTIKSSL